METIDGLAGQAYDQLKQAILRGELNPGEALFESHLADKLKMSRTPVREALRVLARDGFVEAGPRGFGVPRRSLEDLCELFELRESLEGMASRAAAVRASDAEIAELERLCKQYEKAKGLENWAKVGTEFHNKIIAASRNGRLATILDSLKEQILLSRQSALRSTDCRREDAMREHRQILNAIKARDGDEAERVARSHVRQSYEATLQFYRTAL